MLITRDHHLRRVDSSCASALAAAPIRGLGTAVSNLSAFVNAELRCHEGARAAQASSELKIRRILKQFEHSRTSPRLAARPARCLSRTSEAVTIPDSD